MSQNAHWTWCNIGRGLDVDSASTLQDRFFRSDACVEFYRSAFYAAAGLILLFSILAQIASRLDVGGYQRLTGAARLTLVCHMAFFIIFATTTFPFTIAMLKIFFAPLGPLYLLQKTTYRCIAYPLGFQLTIYALEGGCRAVVNTNYFLVAHHIMFCTLTVLAFQPESLYMVYVCIIFSCFATFEFPLYLALISRKVQALGRHFSWLLIVSISFYGFSRMLQSAMLLSLFVYAFVPMSHSSKDKALYWVGLVMSLALSALQLWTFVIYYNVWHSTATKAAHLTHHETHHGHALPSAVNKMTHQQQGVPQILRIATASLELPSHIDGKSSLELVRSNIHTSSGSDIFSSQTLLLESTLHQAEAHV